MADQSNDTQSKINEEDRDIAVRPENRTGHDRNKWNQGSGGMPGGGGETAGMARTTGGAAVSVPRSGGSELDNEYGAQHSNEPGGADHQHSALGGSVTAAGGNSESPGPGQAGTLRSGFLGSEANEGAEAAQRRGSAEQPVQQDSGANDTGESNSF